MSAVSRARFVARHNKFKVQQQANLAQFDQTQTLQGVERQLSRAATAALTAHRHHTGGPTTAPARERQVAAARSLLQMQDAVRREKKRNRNFAFHELRARRDEFRR